MVHVLIHPSYGNPAARSNWGNTLAREVDFDQSRFSSALAASQREVLRREHPTGRARFWGAVAAHDRRMADLVPGDVVLFTGMKHVLAVGEIGVSLRNAAFADLMWSPDPVKGSFHNVYSLRSFENTTIRYEDVWNLPSFKVGDNFMGLRLLSDDRAAEVIEGLGIETVESSASTNEFELRMAAELERLVPTARLPTVGLIPAENIHTLETSYRPAGRTVIVQRTEGLLVRAYCRFAGVENSRRQVPSGITDLSLVGPDGEELVEAKGGTSTGHVRAAIGQLLDYVRHCPEVTVLTALFPQRPSDQALNLLSHFGVDCVYRVPHTSRFERISAAEEARAGILRLAHA